MTFYVRCIDDCLCYCRDKPEIEMIEENLYTLDGQFSRKGIVPHCKHDWHNCAERLTNSQVYPADIKLPPPNLKHKRIKLEVEE